MESFRGVDIGNSINVTIFCVAQSTSIKIMGQFILTVILDEEHDNKGNWKPLHQCLLMLFDSPLNHAGHLEVLIRLADGRVVKMHREVRIPRTYKRFEQLFSNFLQGCDMPLVETKDGPTRLLQFLGKSLEKQLQSTDCQRYRISNLAPRLKSPENLTTCVDSLKRAAVFIGFGPVDFNILGDGKETRYEIKTIDRQSPEDTYSISRYPLSPSLTCVKLATSFERALDVF